MEFELFLLMFLRVLIDNFSKDWRFELYSWKIEEVGYYSGRGGIDYMLDESGVYLEGSVVSEDGNVYIFDFREEGGDK